MHRVDENRLNIAIDAGKCILKKQDKKGNYSTKNHWGPEGEIYRAICSWIFLDLYEITKKTEFLNGAKILLDRFKERQMTNGGWSLSLGKDGQRFKVNEEERYISKIVSDPIVAGAILKGIASYKMISKDDTYDDTAEKAFSYLKSVVNVEKAELNTTTDKSIINLRSDPSAYNFLLLLAFESWIKFESRIASNYFNSMLKSVTKVFENFNEKTMPLMIGYHVAILSKHKKHSYLKNTIKNILDNHIEKGLFRSSKIIGGYGHRDGLRGIVNDELHIRSAIGYAIAFKSYDYYYGKKYYTSSNTYSNLIKWIENMFSRKGCFYEYQNEKSKLKLGHGSAAQYLPILWILGTLQKKF